MLHGQKLQDAYDDFIINYSTEKGLTPKTIRNKKDILGKLIPFLEGRPLTFETCRQYSLFMYDNGWTKPNSKVNIIKNLRAFVAFLYDREYIEVNFAHKLVKPKVNREPLRLPSEQDAENCIIAGTEPGLGDNSRNQRIKGETRLCLQFILRTGLRISEALSLQGTDLSPFDDQPFFYVKSKGGNITPMPIPEDMIKEMRNRIKHKRVFQTTEKTCNKNLADGARIMKITLSLTCHKLRHIYTLARLRNGNSLQLVSRTLRHTSVAITDKYYSNYLLEDMAVTINDSALIKNALSVEELMIKAVDAFKKAIGKDNRISVTAIIDDNGYATVVASVVK
jgi:site-specific recombinase XerD